MRIRIRCLRGGHDSGQAAVEFALVLPVLMLVVVAICQVALTLDCYLVVTAASREGARRGAETNDSEAARQAALKAAEGLPGGPPEVQVGYPEGRGRGGRVKVTLVYRMPLLGGLGGLLPQVRFSRSTTMILERDEQ